MRFRIYGMVLSLFFALGLVFSFGMEASATHDEDDMRTTADEVDPTDRADVEALLNHIIDYYNQEYSAHRDDPDARTRAVIIFGRQIRIDSEDGGLYKHGDIYSMALNESGTITNHGGYPHRFGYQFNPGAADSEVANIIQTLITNSAAGMPPDCQQYGGSGRWACATKVPSDLGPITVIAGLHHAENDTAFTLPDCSDFILETTAEDVYNDQSNDNLLEAYVKEVIEVAQNQRKKAADEQLAEFIADGGNPIDLQDQTSEAAREFGIGMIQKIYSKVACFGTGDLEHENIYAFIMSADLESATVLFNGNNFDLNGASLELVDDRLSGEQNIARLFNQKLGEPVNGANTYVNYHWDDPTTEEDNVPNFFRDRKVPGDSCKRSYIQVADINANLSPSPGEELYIFGSGTYPGEEACAGGDGEMTTEENDGDGCAIAGTGHTSQSIFLNLFLISSVLFSVVFLRRRT